MLTNTVLTITLLCSSQDCHRRQADILATYRRSLQNPLTTRFNLYIVDGNSLSLMACVSTYYSGIMATCMGTRILGHYI